MAQTFCLRLLLAGHDDLIYEVREPEAERLKRILAREDWAEHRFWFDTIDGRSVLVNLAYLQGVRYLWDFVMAPPDLRISPDDDMRIALHGREVLSESPSEDPRDVYTLFCELELRLEKVTFTDVDGEDFTLITEQIVYLTAPKEVVDEGRRRVEAEDGLDEA